MATSAKKALFNGPVANAATQYIGIPVGLDGRVAIQLAWKDATSNGTVTLQYTLYPADEAPVDQAGSAWHWVASGTSITGPGGTAAGASVTQVTGLGPNVRARLRFVASANSSIEVYAETV